MQTAIPSFICPCFESAFRPDKLFVGFTEGINHASYKWNCILLSMLAILQVFAIELVTFAVDFVQLAVELAPLQLVLQSNSL